MNGHGAFTNTMSCSTFILCAHLSLPCFPLHGSQPNCAQERIEINPLTTGDFTIFILQKLHHKVPCV